MIWIVNDQLMSNLYNFAAALIRALLLLGSESSNWNRVKASEGSVKSGKSGTRLRKNFDISTVFLFAKFSLKS